MVRESKVAPGINQAESILKQICDSNNINFDFLDAEVSTRFRQKIKSLMTPILNGFKKGGKQGQQIVDKLKDTVYKLKLGGLKRKLEHDLERETKRRKIAESEARINMKVAREYKRSAKKSLYYIP